MTHSKVASTLSERFSKVAPHKEPQLVAVVDAYGRKKEQALTGEFPLTVYLNRREIVTLMTLGQAPELLAIGYLLNQGLLSTPQHIIDVQVDWSVSAVVVVSDEAEIDDERLSKKTVTSGCGQGTMYGDVMSHIEKLKLPQVRIKQSNIYQLLDHIVAYNQVYRQSGAVHGCALCQGDKIIHFVEDVGRHNAADVIAAKMWLDNIDGNDKLFYTTGRLTSEMVIKTAQMNIPVLLSRSGMTSMGLNIAQQTGMILIARSKGQFFQVFNGADRIDFDAMPRSDMSTIDIKNKMEKKSDPNV